MLFVNVSWSLTHESSHLEFPKSQTCFISFSFPVNPQYTKSDHYALPSSGIVYYPSPTMEMVLLLLLLLCCCCCVAAAAAAKSLQWYPTLCNPIDGSRPGFPVPGILQVMCFHRTCIDLLKCYFSHCVILVSLTKPQASIGSSCDYNYI